MNNLPEGLLDGVEKYLDQHLSLNNNFKQCPKFIAAVDKLYNGMQPSNIFNNNDGVIPTVTRKMDLNEIRKIIKEVNSPKNILQEPQVDVLKLAAERKKSLTKKIECILDDINKTAEKDETPKLFIRNQRLWTNCIFDLDRVTLKSSDVATKTLVSYSSSHERSRFNGIVFILTKVHELLTKNLTVTRREIFYQNVVRFRSQSNVDMAVRDVCCLLESPPWELGLIATAKGLIAGPLQIESSNGKLIDCMAAGGTLIPQDVTGIKSFKSKAKYILVVEKDAIFQKLLDEGALLRLGPVIIMTGKGYPDVCTRQLLTRLSRELNLRPLALVDADPHGYEIFLTYKYGSLAQSHLSSSLACGSLMMLGTRYPDILTLAPVAARLRLTEIDKRKINSILKRPYICTPTGAAISEDLRAMLSGGVKAELEAVAPTAAALCDAYLPSKIIQGDYLG